MVKADERYGEGLTEIDDICDESGCGSGVGSWVGGDSGGGLDEAGWLRWLVLGESDDIDARNRRGGELLAWIADQPSLAWDPENGAYELQEGAAWLLAHRFVGAVIEWRSRCGQWLADAVLDVALSFPAVVGSWDDDLVRLAAGEGHEVEFAEAIAQAVIYRVDSFWQGTVAQDGGRWNPILPRHRKRARAMAESGKFFERLSVEEWCREQFRMSLGQICAEHPAFDGMQGFGGKASASAPVSASGGGDVSPMEGE